MKSPDNDIRQHVAERVALDRRSLDDALTGQVQSVVWLFDGGTLYIRQVASKALVK